MFYYYKGSTEEEYIRFSKRAQRIDDGNGEEEGMEREEEGLWEAAYISLLMFVSRINSY